SVVQEINRINEKELELGLGGASWHDDYKDSAYIYVGGLHFDLTEGDVITIFSQYGEVVDVNLPRDKETGKTRGFGFLMYEDQRSTVLAVDNLNGANVLNKTLRVDHVKNYKQQRTKGEDGEWVDQEEQSMNAKPQLVDDDGGSESSASSAPDIDPDDPMRDYLLEKWREERAAKKTKKTKSKGKHKNETPEERRARKERKKEKKGKRHAKKSDGLKAAEALLKSLGRRDRGEEDEGQRRGPSPSPSRSPRRSRSRSLPMADRRDAHRHSRSRSRSPARTRPRGEDRSPRARDRGYSPDPRTRRRPR
ncbi:hypothetical protein FA95DRAFT_1462851, partial [Auriscalpium vulgare]